MPAINGIPLINGVEFAWGDIVAILNGVPLVGIVAIQYGDDQEVVNHYGAGRHPISRSKGNITPTAKITLKMAEVVAIQSRALNGRLQDIAPFDLIVSYLPESGAVTTDKVRNCQFKANSRDWSQGDTTEEVELELIPSHIEWGKLP